MGGFVLLGRDATDNFFFFQKIFFQNKRGCRRVASLFQRRNHPEWNRVGEPETLGELLEQEIFTRLRREILLGFPFFFHFELFS